MSPDQQTSSEAVTEFLLLPDGRILVHNLSPTMAAILSELCPDDEALAQRATCAQVKSAQPSNHSVLLPK